MEELLRTAGAVATPLIAVAALIISIRASKHVKHQRDFEIVLEENRREAARREDLFWRERAKREAAMQALFDRSDRRFDALLARSDELARQLAEVVARAVPNETRVSDGGGRIPHGSRSFSSGAGRDRGGGSAGRSQRAPSQVTAGSLPAHVDRDAAMRARRTARLFLSSCTMVRSRHAAAAPESETMRSPL